MVSGIFPVLTIIMLGSAAGDPMLYSDVGLLPASLIFILIVILYRIADYLIAQNERLETISEGRAVRFIKDNRFNVEQFKSNEINKDELLADLRKQGVSQLGQVTAGYIEAEGDISVFFYPNDEVKYGLPILPEQYSKQVTEIPKEANYSCRFCGHTEYLRPVKGHECPVCKKNKWVEASKDIRVG